MEIHGRNCYSLVPEEQDSGRGRVSTRPHSFIIPPVVPVIRRSEGGKLERHLGLLDFRQMEEKVARHTYICVHVNGE